MTPRQPAGARITVGDLTAAALGQTIRLADGRRGQLTSFRHFLVDEKPRTSLIISNPSYRPGVRGDAPWREIPVASDAPCTLKD